MFKSLANKFALIIFLFFSFYLVWLYRAYADVAWMDQIQFLAGNIKHYYEGSLTVQDFYYRPPFLLFFSNLFLFINCELFGYNTCYENILSGIFLLLMALYFVRANIKYFEGNAKIYFAALVGFIVFGLQKWELSLWSGGYSHFMVVFIVYICIDIIHKYYLHKNNSRLINKYFIPVYLVLAIVAILECTAYFLPFQLGVLLLLLINYKVFREYIDVKRWRSVLLLSIGLLAFALFVNQYAEVYSAKNSYDGYPKVNISENVSRSFDKVFTDPIFVIKFYLLANTGNLIDNESYASSTSAKSLMPFIGLLVLAAYAFVLYVFIRKKKMEYLFPIGLIIYAVTFYALVLVGRMKFNDVFFGTSSRYSSATFAGILGMVTIFMLLVQERKSQSLARRAVYLVPVTFVILCYIITNLNQWKIAPYRKENYKQMAINIKENKDLEVLQAYNVESVQIARDVMIRNQLNIFKPETKLTKYQVNSDFENVTAKGFYDKENSSKGSYRWTTGRSELYLPNLYTKKDSIKVKLAYYTPYPDTPVVILNDNMKPSGFKTVDGGLEYTFPICKERVIFRASIENKSFVPNKLDSSNSDTRTLGLIFNSLSISE